MYVPESTAFSPEIPHFCVKQDSFFLIQSGDPANVFTLAWGGFTCLEFKHNRRKKCTKAATDKVGDHGFQLHGLWPNRQNPHIQGCSKSAVKRALDYAKQSLSDDISKYWNSFNNAQDFLLNHEISKHGCQYKSISSYFWAILTQIALTLERGTLMSTAFWMNTSKWLWKGPRSTVWKIC